MRLPIRRAFWLIDEMNKIRDKEIAEYKKAAKKKTQN